MNARHTGQPSDLDPLTNDRGEREAVRLCVAAWAGIIGPLLFTATFMVQETFRTDEYSPLEEPVSALEAGPNGWVQQLNFVVFGLLTIAFAAGLHRGVMPSRAGVLGPALLLVSGSGCCSPRSSRCARTSPATYDPGGHIVAGLTFFLSSAVGLIALSRRLASDRKWRSLAAYTLVAGAAALAGFVAMGALVMPDEAPLHDWAGLGQRALILVVLFPCRIVLAARLLQIATGRR